MPKLLIMPKLLAKPRLLARRWLPPRHRLLIWRAPVVLGMARIAGPSLLVYGNALHRLVAGVPMYSDTALHGVQNPAPPPELTRAALVSAAFMHATAASFGRHFPLLAAAVRAKGQIYWSVLHQSPPWFITIGRHDVLYENSYLDEYCSRDIAATRPRAEAWAAKLMRMQRWYRARGKLFLYLLTPSKAAIEPEDMPAGWPCAASATDRLGLHAAYRAILQRAGVNLVDTVETTLKAKQAFPFPPFPATGTHFNAVSTALAVRQLIAVMTEAGGWRRIDDFTFNWRLGKPNDVDADLLEALNVPYPGLHEQTPAISILPTQPKRCTPVRMAQVGGSFTYQLDKVLQRLACPPDIDLYEYYRNTMAFYPGDRRYPVDPRRRAWALLDAAEVVVLEENELLAPASQHGEAFYALVAARIAADRSGAR